MMDDSKREEAKALIAWHRRCAERYAEDAIEASTSHSRELERLSGRHLATARILEAAVMGENNRDPFWDRLQDLYRQGDETFGLIPALTPPADPTDDVKTDALRWLANYHGSIDSTALVMAYKAGARRRSTPATREEIARLAKQAIEDGDYINGAAGEAVADALLSRFTVTKRDTETSTP